MSTIITKEIYDAFIEAGASEQKATDAARVMTDSDKQFKKIVTDLLILKWMVGFVLAVNVLSLLKSMFA